MQHARTHHVRPGASMPAVPFPTDPSGLPEATRPELLEVADGDVLHLRIGPVAKRFGDTTVRILAARRLDGSVTQLHSAGYRNPQPLPDGPVLVVGGGNSGFQIAEELAATRQVGLSIATKVPMLPQRLAGKDLFWQHTRGSALLGFVGDDAAYLARRITSNASSLDVTDKESVHA